MRALFIHSGWRTGSTYFWTKFRQQPGCLGFYEPFNEMLSAMSPTDIFMARHDLNALNHSAIGLPYFHEYLPLLGPKGHPLFKLDFSYRNYFCVDAAALNDQQAYIDSLLAYAQKTGKTPVLGFVRSLGRAAWFRQVFQPAVNVVVIRSPLGQWMSARQLALKHRHEFLDPMQILILAQARGSDAAIEEARRFGLPRLDDHPLQAGYALAQTLSAKLSPQDRFRIFASVYTLSYLAALPAADLVVDMDRLSSETDYQATVKSEILRLTGLDLDFSDAKMPRHVAPDVDLRETLATILNDLPAIGIPHPGIDAGRVAAARARIHEKFEADRALLAG